MKRNITIIIFITIITVIITITVIIFIKNKPAAQPTPAPAASQISSTDKPQIVATKPDPLDENIVFATDIIEITFNRSLENAGEFKSRIDPKTDYRVELSGDRKTARIIPTKPYTLGTTYTLFIGTETKFDGIGRWGEEKIFHFRTIKYTGV